MISAVAVDMRGQPMKESSQPAVMARRCWLEEIRQHLGSSSVNVTLITTPLKCICK